MDLARKACQDGCIAHATLELWVDEQLKFIASEALLTLCAEAEAAVAGCQDYSICLEDETSNPTAGLWKYSSKAMHSTASASPSGSAGDPPARCADKICLCILTQQCRDSIHTSPKRIID